MTVAAHGLCKNVLALGVVKITLLARNNEFCPLILILLQMPVGVYGHIFSVLADVNVEAIASLDLLSLTRYLFLLMKMQPSSKAPYFLMLCWYRAKNRY